jgi:hypothetical protein
VLLLAWVSAAHAGPWVREPGDWYAKVGASRFWSSSYVDPRADTALSYVGWQLGAYGELGVGRGVQVVAAAPWVWATNTDAASGWTFRAVGPGDATVGVVVDVPGVWWPLSVSARARLPLVDQRRLPSAYPAFGDPNVDVDAVVATGGGWAWGGQGFWVSAETGFRWRTPLGLGAGDYANGLPYVAQVGWKPTVAGVERGWLGLEASGLVRLADEPQTRAWHQVGLNAAVPLGRGVHAELSGQRVLRAVASSEGWGVGVGVSHTR